MTLLTDLCDANCSSVKYSTIKDFEHIYIPILITTFAITVIFSMFSILVIWKRSTEEMETYKWCLLNIILSSFSLEALITLWMPVPIFPIYGGYNAGILKYLPIEVNYILFMLCMAIFVNLLLASCNFLLYQVAHLKYTGLFNKLFASKKVYVTVYLSFYVILSVVIIIPIWLARNNDIIWENFMILQYPSLVALSKNEQTFGFNSNIIIFSIILSIFLISYFIVMIFLFLLAKKSLHETKNVVTENVSKLQHSLYYTFLIQTLFSMIIFLTPLIFVVIMSILADDLIFRLGMLTIIIVSFHAPICSLSTILTIGVYRNYIGKILFRKTNPIDPFTKMNIVIK